MKYYDASVTAAERFKNKASGIDAKFKKCRHKEKISLAESFAAQIEDTGDVFNLAIYRFESEINNKNNFQPAVSYWRECYEKNTANTATENARFKEALLPLKTNDIRNRLLNSTPFSFCLSFRFTTETPWFSRAESSFSVTDNPLRVCPVTGLPEMQASSWKGLVRSACHLVANDRVFSSNPGSGLPNSDLKQGLDMLFGAEDNEEKDNGQAGALVFFPSFFLPAASNTTNRKNNTKQKNYIRADVLTPLDQEKRIALKGPIYYPVLDAGNNADFLLAFDGSICYYQYLKGTPAARIAWGGLLSGLADAIEFLFTGLGFSAKRSSGYGIASHIEDIKLYHKNLAGEVCRVEDSNNLKDEHDINSSGFIRLRDNLNNLGGLIDKELKL